MDSTSDSMISLPQVDAMQPPRDWQSRLLGFLVIGASAIPGLVLARLILGAIVVRGYLLDAAPLLVALEWLVYGLAASVVSLGVILILQLQRSALNQARAINQRLAALTEHTANQASAAHDRSEPDPQLIELRRLLADMREIMLLPEEQRQARFRIMMRTELQRRLALANQYVVAREFHRARAELASLNERFGPTDDIRTVEQYLSNAMSSALSEDIETATRKVSDLMTMGRWAHAEQYARELTEKYPDAVEPRNLVERVQEERLVFDRRHRQRMHDEIQQFVTQRRWREAAGAAELFIQTFPTGVDADALRQQLETLKANSEIEIRQQLERHIKEHVARKDYWAALELARRIITEYPFSPQANVLRMQLPKLEDLARQQGPRV